MSDQSVMSDELKYLLWFWQNADFGPADGDVRIYMEERYEKLTGDKVPSGYSYRDEEEENE